MTKFIIEIVAIENSNELLGIDNFLLVQGVNNIDKLRIETSVEDDKGALEQTWPKRASTEKLAI